MIHALFNEDVSELQILILVQLRQIVAGTRCWVRNLKLVAHLLSERCVYKLNVFGLELLECNQKERNQELIHCQLLWRHRFLRLGRRRVSRYTECELSRVFIRIDFVNGSNNVVPLLNLASERTKERLAFLVAPVGVK